jgi:regulator of replication initiation timing
VTVPGKGGRPRKWRSDADRQRAFRARSEGREEPPTLVQALDDGDELARVWEMIRDLGARLDTANETIKTLRRERNKAVRAMTNNDRRWGWIEAENTSLRTERDRRAAERDALSVENTELRQRLAQLTQANTRPVVEAPPAPTPAPKARQLSRAERRQQERQHRRRQP